MAYPRKCEGCGLDYEQLPSLGLSTHVTLDARDGGTVSPWAQDRPGRLLDIGCRACGSIFTWDYFAPGNDGRLGALVRMRRGSVDGWAPMEVFTLRRTAGSGVESQARAS